MRAVLDVGVAVVLLLGLLAVFSGLGLMFAREETAKLLPQFVFGAWSALMLFLRAPRDPRDDQSDKPKGGDDGPQR